MGESDTAGAQRTSRAFDAVVFDFSGVIVSSAFEVLTAVLKNQLPYEEAVAFMLGPYDEDTDHPWHRVERGELAVLAWVEHIETEAQRRGLSLDWDAIARGGAGITVQSPVVDRVRSLRAEGYGTALLTNNIVEASEAWRAMVPVDELFDVVVDSSSVGLRKPDPRIYLLTLDRLGGVAPERAVFLDDHPGNVAGAERAGLRALLVADPLAAVRDLDRLLGKGDGTGSAAAGSAAAEPPAGSAAAEPPAADPA